LDGIKSTAQCDGGKRERVNWRDSGIGNQHLDGVVRNWGGRRNGLRASTPEYERNDERRLRYTVWFVQ
jgi:hypothetical protein